MSELWSQYAVPILGFLNLAMAALVMYLGRFFLRKDDWSKYLKETAAPLKAEVEIIAKNHGDRINNLEHRMKSMPDKDAIHELSIYMQRLTGELKASEERMRGFEKLSQRMQTQIDIMDSFLRKMERQK
tara:strand:+ start:162 stop:548 length:387 start_codon:yes stop_codon:yes gene_type:complete